MLLERCEDVCVFECVRVCACICVCSIHFAYSYGWWKFNVIQPLPAACVVLLALRLLPLTSLIN